MSAVPPEEPPAPRMSEEDFARIDTEAKAVFADREGMDDTPPRPVYDVAGILGRSGAGGPRFRTGIDTFDERLTLKTQPTNIGTPLKRILGLEGAPSAGKSVALGQAARGLASQGLRVVMLVLDEAREDAAERIGQGLGFRHAELNAEYPGTVAAVRQKCSDLGLDLSIIPDEEADESEPTIEDAAEYLFSVPNEKGYVLAVDSLHRVRSRTEREDDDQRTRIRLRMSAFRKLTRGHRDLLIVYTAEVNRGAYASKDKSKRTSALAAGAEGRDIEYASNAIFFLTRENESDIVQVEVPKNKIGRKQAPFSLQLHEGSASLKTISEETMAGTAEGKRAEYLLQYEDKVVAYLTEAADWMSVTTITAAKLGPRQDIRDAIQSAFKKGKIARQPAKTQGYVYRVDVNSPNSPETCRKLAGRVTPMELATRRALVERGKLASSEGPIGGGNSPKAKGTSETGAALPQAEAPPCTHEQRKFRWKGGRKWLVCVECGDEQPAEAPTIAPDAPTATGPAQSTPPDDESVRAPAGGLPMSGRPCSACSDARRPELDAAIAAGETRLKALGP